MSDAIATMICWTYVGYIWGQFFAERKAKKSAKNGDVCFQLIYRMMSSILEKRQFVGRAMEISRTEQFEVVGEKFSLTLKSEAAA